MQIQKLTSEATGASGIPGISGVPGQSGAIVHTYLYQGYLKKADCDNRVNQELSEPKALLVLGKIWIWIFATHVLIRISSGAPGIRLVASMSISSAYPNGLS